MLAATAAVVVELRNTAKEAKRAALTFQSMLACPMTFLWAIFRRYAEPRALIALVQKKRSS